MSLEPSASLSAAVSAARLYFNHECIIDQSQSDCEKSHRVILALANVHVCYCQPCYSETQALI